MVDLAITGKKRFPTAGIFMGARQQSFCKVEQCVSSPRISKIDQAGELQAPGPAVFGQHVALLQVVMAKHRSRAISQKVEARLRFVLQAARQAVLSALL